MPIEDDIIEEDYKSVQIDYDEIDNIKTEEKTEEKRAATEEACFISYVLPSATVSSHETFKDKNDCGIMPFIFVWHF